MNCIFSIKPIYIFLFSVVLMVSTGSCKSNSHEATFELLAKEPIVQIELDSLTSNVSNWLSFFYDSEQDSGLVFSIDNDQNELELYSLESGGLVSKLKFQEEGPAGVGRLSAISILALDSILIFPPFTNEYFGGNLTNKTLKKGEFQKPDGFSSINSQTRFFRSIPFLKDNYLYTKTLFGGNYLLLENEELSGKPLMYRVDLSDGAVEFSKFTFPDDYWADGKRHYEFSSALNDNQLVFSFHSDHNIYYGVSFDEPLKKKLAKSKYLSQEFEDLPLGSDANARRRYFATTGHYGNLLYDQFRDVYYRFCYPKKEVEKDEDLRELVMFPQEFSVMILNSELDVIGETLLGNNDDKYATSNVFVGPAGLYISVNHPKSELNREESFGFQLFTLEIKAQ
jgi:hypothetical protein